MQETVPGYVQRTARFNENAESRGRSFPFSEQRIFLLSRDKKALPAEKSFFGF
jgi:hypothetical protein